MAAKAIGAAITGAKSYALVPDEYYWISNDEYEYIPVKYVGAPGDTSGGAPRMCEFIGYNSEARVKAPSSRIKGRIPAPAEVHLNPKNIKSDLVQNDDVSEPSVLWALRQRYKTNLIYSSIGTILIAINPYKIISELYTQENMTAYMQAAADANLIRVLSASTSKVQEVELQPHIWSVAAAAYKQMRSPLVAASSNSTGEESAISLGNVSGGRQAIIISGESGAGKTEATKMCLQYLSAVAHLASSSTSAGNTYPQVDSTAGSLGSPGRAIPRKSSLKHASPDIEYHGDTATAGGDSGANMYDFASLPIEERVLGTNPLLESFGNAKTSRNNNSSRFGKWLEIIFVNRDGKASVSPSDSSDDLAASFNKSVALAQVTLTGANITEYLLEKSRVVSQAAQERNYHIFYQLCADPTMGMRPAVDYQFLNQSGPEHMQIDGVDDAEDILLTKGALHDLGFSQEDQHSVFDALKAIVSMGNIDFEADSAGSECHVKRGECMSMLTTCAKLLGVQVHRVQTCLTTRTITVRGETMNMALDVPQAVQTRNAFAKEIYGRIFSHIVRQVNIALLPDGSTAADGSAITRKPSDLCIGLLDIFGFEIFDHNTFEQLCINYANEKLQQYFIAYVLKKEQEVYISEQLDIVQVVPRDNDDVLRLIEGKPLGLLPRLDEEVKLSGNDASYLRKIDRDHNTKTDSKSKDASDELRRFNRTIKTKVGHFEIRHFAGLVVYDSDGFVEKNKDKLYDHLESLIDEFTNDPLKRMLQEFRKLLEMSAAAAPQRPGRRTSNFGAGGQDAPTISTRFQAQLNKLMTILGSSSPHFVRCIKPNNSKHADAFKAPLVLQQLRYSGVLEAIQIRKTGFPVRRKHAEFWRSYWSLAVTSHKGDAEDASDVDRNTRAPINSRSRWWKKLSDREKCCLILEGLNMRAQDEYAALVAEEKKTWYQNNNQAFVFTEALKVTVGNKWSLNIYDSSQMMAGRTLVFFKPEALTALEKEKIRRGMSAVLFSQAAVRRIIAMKRFLALQKAHSQLRTLLQKGCEKQKSNISALVELKECTQHCEFELKMICFIIKDCKKMIERLTAVADCIFKVRLMLSLYFPEKYRQYLHYLDFESVNECTNESDKCTARAAIACLEENVNELNESVTSVNRQFDRDLVEDFAIMTELLKLATNGKDVDASEENNERGIISVRKSSASFAAGSSDVSMDPNSTGLFIDAVEVADLRLKHLEIEDRANGLLVLRRAIAECDEDVLRSALRHVGILNVKYQNLNVPKEDDSGSSESRPDGMARRLSRGDSFVGEASAVTAIIGHNFCEREELEAQALLKRLCAERVVLEEVTDLLSQFHIAYTDRLHEQQWSRQAIASANHIADDDEDSDVSSNDSGEVEDDFFTTVQGRDGNYVAEDDAQEEAEVHHNHADGHYHKGASIYHPWASDEVAEGADSVDYDPHAHGSFSHSQSEWLWFTGACKSLNEQITQTLTDFTINPEVARASQEAYSAAVASSHGAPVEESEILLVLAPVAVKIFTAFMRLLNVNDLWYQKNWKDLSAAVNALWEMLDEIKSIMGSSSGDAKDFGGGVRRKSVVAVELLERAQLAEASFEEHIRYVRKELDQYYILPLLQECMLLSSGSKIIKSKQESLNRELKELKDMNEKVAAQAKLVVADVSTSKPARRPSDFEASVMDKVKAIESHHDDYLSREHRREADEDAWSLYKAISTLEKQCINWATEKSKLVLARARVLALVRLCIYYDRWIDLLSLTEDTLTTQDRKTRHANYLHQLKDIKTTDVSSAFLGNENTFKTNRDRTRVDTTDGTFDIKWEYLPLTSVKHARKSLEKLERIHLAIQDGDTTGKKRRKSMAPSKNPPAMGTLLEKGNTLAIEPDQYIHTAQVIEDELWSLRIVGVHEYSLTLLRDSLVLCESDTPRSPNNAGIIPLELAIEEIKILCRTSGGEDKNEIEYLDKSMQNLIKTHFLEVLRPLRLFVEHEEWQTILNSYYSKNKLPLLSAKSSTRDEISSWVVRETDNYVGSNFYWCLRKLRAETENIVHKAFNGYYIAELIKSFGKRSDRVCTNWAVGSVGMHDFSSTELAGLVDMIAAEGAEYATKYQSENVSIVSEELQFFIQLAVQLGAARDAMKHDPDNTPPSELSEYVIKQKNALLPFQELYGMIQLEDSEAIIKPHELASLIPMCVSREISKMTTEWQYLTCRDAINKALAIHDNGARVQAIDFIIEISQFRRALKPEDRFSHYPEYIQREIQALIKAQENEKEANQAGMEDASSKNFTLLSSLLDFLAEDDKTLDFEALSTHFIDNALNKCEDLDTRLEKLEWEHKRRQAINSARKQAGGEVSDSSDEDDEEDSMFKHTASSRASIYAASPHAMHYSNTEETAPQVSSDPRFCFPVSLTSFIRVLFSLKQVREAFVNGKWMDVKAAVCETIQSPPDVEAAASNVPGSSEGITDAAATKESTVSTAASSIMKSRMEGQLLIPAENSVAAAFPQMCQELSMVLDHVDNYLLISACEGALVPFAQLVVKNVHKKTVIENYPSLRSTMEESLVKLEQCAHLCTQIGCATQRSRQLNDAVQFLYKLRTLQLHGWEADEVREKLIEAELGGLGMKGGATEVLRPDLLAAKMELINYSLILKVELCLEEEQLRAQKGLIEFSDLDSAESCEEAGEIPVTLEKALDEALALPTAARSGTLSILLPLVHMAAKTHKIARQTLFANGNGVGSGSLVGLELEEQLSGYAEALSTFQVQYAAHYGVDTHAHLGFGVLLLTHHAVERMVKIVIAELDVIAVHFMIVRMDLELREAICRGGMLQEMVGHMEFSEDGNGNPLLDRVEIKSICDVIARKNDYLADCDEDTGKPVFDFPEQMLQLFEIAELMVDMRGDIRNGHELKWVHIAEVSLPKVQALMKDLASYVTADSMGPRPTYVLHVPKEIEEEIVCIELECLHRWVCANVLAALGEGAPIDTEVAVAAATAEGKTYPLSAAALSLSCYEHLEECLDNVRQRAQSKIKRAGVESDNAVAISSIMPSPLATSLVYTAELLLPLRRMLHDGTGSVVWELVQEACEHLLLQPIYVRSTPSVPGLAQRSPSITVAKTADKSPLLAALTVSPPAPPPPAPKRASVLPSLPPPPPPGPPRRSSIMPSASPPPPLPSVPPPVSRMAPPPAPSVTATATAVAKPAAIKLAVHPIVRSEVAFISRLANDFVICSSMVQALHSGSGKTTASESGSVVVNHPYGSPGDLNVSAISILGMQRALDCSQALDTLHGKGGDEPLPDIDFYQSPMHCELVALCSRMLGLRQALVLKYQLKAKLAVFFNEQAENHVGIYEIYRVLEGGALATSAADNKDKPKPRFSDTLSPARSSSVGAMPAAALKSAPVLTHSRALELKKTMDDLTNRVLEAHRKVQILAEDVEATASLGGIQAHAVVQSELQFVRADCHVTDVQNSLSDSCIRTVRFYEKKSEASLRDVLGEPQGMPRRRLSSVSAREGSPIHCDSTNGRNGTPVQREHEREPVTSVLTSPRSNNGILLSPSGSPLTVPLSASKRNTTTASAAALAEPDADDEAADAMLEDINYILHAISSGPSETQPIGSHHGVISHTVQLATFLLKLRDLVLIKGDVGSVMQIIAALQQQHSEACKAKRLKEEGGAVPSDVEHSLLALVLQSPYVRMEYQWVYRHTTNSYIMLMLRAGLVYTAPSKAAGDSDDEAAGGDVNAAAGGSLGEWGCADLPNPTSIYMHGSPLLTDTKQFALRRSIDAVDAYIMTAMSPHSAMSSGNDEDAALDIFGNKIIAANEEKNAQEREAQVGRRGSIGNLISKMNTSDVGGGRRGARVNTELYTSTDTMLAFCRAVLSLRSALIVRDSDAILVTMKQWLLTVDVTKRHGNQGVGGGVAFSTSNFLKPITPNSSNITTGSKQREQLPAHYLQEMKNIYVSHQNDLLVTSLLRSLKDSGIRENTPALVAINRKEWELRHDAQQKRLASLEHLLLQFDHLQEESRMPRRSFSYQFASNGDGDGDGASADVLKIDCDSDRSEEVVLGSVLGNNTGNSFIWEPLQELVAVSRLIFALRSWLLTVDSTYAAFNTDKKHADASSMSESEDDRLIAVGSEIVRGLEDQMPPPILAGSPQDARRVFGTGTNGGPNAPVVPFPLVQPELELTRLTVSELMAARAIKKCLLAFQSSEKGSRRYCIRNFQPPKHKASKDKHHIEKHVLIADVDSTTIDVQSLLEVEEYVQSGLKVVINTSLGSAGAAQTRTSISGITPKRYDKLGKIIQPEATDAEAAVPKASYPKGISVGSSSNCYVTRMFNTVQLVRRLRSALRIKDLNSSDDWIAVRNALHDEGLIDAGQLAYFQHARTLLNTEEEYHLAKHDEASQKDQNSSCASKPSRGVPHIAAKYILHEPVDSEIRMLIQQVQARRSLLALSDELAHRDSWCSVPTDDNERDEKAFMTFTTLGTSLSEEELAIERNNPKMLRRRQALLSLRRLHASIAHLEEAKLHFVFKEVPTSEGGRPPLEQAGIFAEKDINEGMSAEIAKDTKSISMIDKVADKAAEAKANKEFHVNKKSTNALALRRVTSKVDTGRIKARSLAKSPMEMALDKEREKHLLARRGKPAAVVGVIGATIHPVIAKELVVEKAVVKLQGPSERNLESLLRSARLVARVRELLLEVPDDIKHVTIASALALMSRSVQTRLGGRSTNDHAAHLVQEALGVHIDLEDVASVIASRDIESIIEANGKEKVSNEILVHAAAVPELSCYYSLLNGQHRQIKAIISRIYAQHSTVRALSTSASAAAASFTAKVQHMATFAGGGARVSEMECVQWLLLRPGSQIASELPGNILSRVGLPAQNPAWVDLAGAILELQQILRLTSRIYGPLWYNNTVSMASCAAPDSIHSDLGVSLLVLSAQDVTDEFKRVTSELCAMEAASENGSHYHPSTYKSTGDAITRQDIFDVSAVERTLRDSLKYALRAHEDSHTVETENGIFQPDGGQLCAAVKHYRRLLRLDALLVRVEQEIGLVRPKSGEDPATYHTDAAHALVLQPAFAEELISTAKKIGGGMWEHPLVKIAHTGLRLLTNSIASATRLAIASACINSDAAAAAAVTVQAREEQYEENSHSLRTFRGLNVHASLAPPSSTNKMTQAYTMLPPLLASLSLWVSENCLDALFNPPDRDRMRPEGGSAEFVQLLTACGRTCPVMRDELFIMVMVRYDSSEAVSQVALWRLLLCLVAAFPPSENFEPYLQAWLQAAKTETESELVCLLANQSLQRMHESIFLNGYGWRLSDYATDYVSEAATAIDALWAVYADGENWHTSGGAASQEEYYGEQGGEEYSEEGDYEEEEDDKVYRAIFDQGNAHPAAATFATRTGDPCNESKEEIAKQERKANMSLLAKILDSSDEDDDDDDDDDEEE